MTQEVLQKIIEQFDEDDMKQSAVFGIVDQRNEQFCIRANKEGLQLYALKLLNASRDAEHAIASNENSMVIDYNEGWIDENSDIFIDSIEIISDSQKITPRQVHPSTMADKLIPVGCGLILIILIVSTIVGLVTVFNWLFSTQTLIKS